jgi:hypothetical protein
MHRYAADVATRGLDLSDMNPCTDVKTMAVGCRSRSAFKAPYAYTWGRNPPGHREPAPHCAGDLRLPSTFLHCCVCTIGR